MMFLYIDPIKQGLKRGLEDWTKQVDTVFIHRSNKTRIETSDDFYDKMAENWFLYIDPIKQGLKHERVRNAAISYLGFYT